MKAIQGIRYSCSDNFQTARPVTLEYKLKRRDIDIWLDLRGGPTGYESMRPFLPKAIRAFMSGTCWFACMGTKGSWDRLIIPASEVLRIIDQKYKEDRPMAKKETSVAIVDEKSLVPSAEAFKELQINLEGIDPVFPQINIIHQGQIFEMPDGTKPATFRGIIIDTNAANAFWLIGFDESGGGDPPDCFSPDSLRPDPGIIEPENQHCKTCDKNQFGSEAPKKEGDETRGKACKNMRRVHVLVEGSFLPYRLSLSPANLKPANLFLTVLASQGFSYLHVITEFGLKVAQNKDGIKYSEVVFKKLRAIESKSVIAQLKSMKETLQGAMRGQVIMPEEYDPSVRKEPADQDE